MDTTNASSADENLSIDWGEADPGDAGEPTELALSVPPDLFGPNDDPDPQFIDGLDTVPDEPEDASPFVVEDLFGDAPAAGPPDDATVMVEDLFASTPAPAPAPATASTPAPAPAPATASATTVRATNGPRLAPERRQAEPRRRRFNPRKLLVPAAVAAVVVGLWAVLDQPPDPAVDVRSAAPADPAPGVTASTRPLPSTTAAPASTTTVDTSPSTTTTTTAAAGGSPVTTAAPAVRARATTAAPRATVAPSPVTTAAPAPVTPPPTAAPVLEVPPIEPAASETTVRPRRTRDTVPPPPPTTDTTGTTDTTDASDDVVEID